MNAKHETPIKAIKYHCLDCSGYSRENRKHCPCTDCHLYPYRLGKNPNRVKKVLTEEQKAVIRDRFLKSRNKV